MSVLVIDTNAEEPTTVNAADWPELANANFNRWRSTDYATWNQIVCRHADGRSLVYVREALPGHAATMKGEFLPATADITNTLNRLAREFGLPGFMPNQCLAALNCG